MEEREICCCGARGWTLAIGWLQMITGILALLVLGIFCLVLQEEDLYDELGLSPTIIWVLTVICLILVILGIIMACVLIRGCKNKNPKQINFWIMYAKFGLVIFVLLTLAELLVTPAEQAKNIFVRCIEVAIQVFFIWVVGIHKSEIEASSGTVVAYKV